MIPLDSDDELMPECIAHCIRMVSSGDDRIRGVYFLCQNEQGIVRGKDLMLKGSDRRIFTYGDLLCGEIVVEVGIFCPSSLFLVNQLRYPTDIITEAVMWSAMWQIFDAHDSKSGLILTEYVGRLYREEHTEEPRITRTISSDRFIKNAIGNQRLLDRIGLDLLQR